MSQPPSPLGTPGSPARKALFLGGAAVVLGLLVALGVLRGRGDAPVAPSAPPSPAPSAPVAAEPPASAAELAQSDVRVRQLVGLLSPMPELGQWLASTEDLVRRFAATVNAVAEGESPRAALAFVAPTGPFQVTTTEGHTFIAPASFARYDTVTRVVGSLDSHTTALTYKALKPLIDAAYQEISRPGQRFDQTLANALQRLIDTPVPEGQIEVVDTPGVNYTFAAPELEQLTAAQKHLVRLGPDNARALQAKLRELRDAFELPAATR